MNSGFGTPETFRLGFRVTELNDENNFEKSLASGLSGKFSGMSHNCTELYYSSCDFSSSPDELDMLHHNLIICKSIIIATILFGHKCAVHTNVFPHKPCSYANAVMGNHVKVTQ